MDRPGPSYLGTGNSGSVDISGTIRTDDGLGLEYLVRGNPGSARASRWQELPAIGSGTGSGYLVLGNVGSPLRDPGQDNGNGPGSGCLGMGNPGSEGEGLTTVQELPLAVARDPGSIDEKMEGLNVVPWTVIGPDVSGRTGRAQDWEGPHWQKWRAGLSRTTGRAVSHLGELASPKGGLV